MLIQLELSGVYQSKYMEEGEQFGELSSFIPTYVYQEITRLGSKYLCFLSDLSWPKCEWALITNYWINFSILASYLNPSPRNKNLPKVDIENRRKSWFVHVQCFKDSMTKTSFIQENI